MKLCCSLHPPSPMFGSIWVHSMRCQGNYERARVAWETVLQHAPNHEEAISYPWRNSLLHAPYAVTVCRRMILFAACILAMGGCGTGNEALDGQTDSSASPSDALRFTYVTQETGTG